MILITILGSGVCIPSAFRSSPSVHLKLNNKSILFDIGSGTLKNMSIAGIPYDTVSDVFITHFHVDHTGDLIPLLFALKNTKNKPLHPLTIHGHKPLKNFFRSLKDAYGDWLYEDSQLYYLDEISPDQTLNTEETTITALKMLHSPESLGYRISVKPDQVLLALSGDTDYNKNLIRICRDADMAILECSFPDELAVSGHLTPSKTGLVAAEAGVKHLVLTHFYPECQIQPVTEIVRKYYNGRISLAEDFMNFQLGR